MRTLGLMRGEVKNDDEFAKNLSSIGDIYINDAFSCSHREQASIHKITKYIANSYAGPLFMKGNTLYKLDFK